MRTTPIYEHDGTKTCLFLHKVQVWVHSCSRATLQDSTNWVIELLKFCRDSGTKGSVTQVLPCIYLSYVVRDCHFTQQRRLPIVDDNNLVHDAMNDSGIWGISLLSASAVNIRFSPKQFWGVNRESGCWVPGNSEIFNLITWLTTPWSERLWNLWPRIGHFGNTSDDEQPCWRF